MSLFNPLSNAIRWVHEVGGVGLGFTVVIDGPGQRGLPAIAVAKRIGAANIIVTRTAQDQVRLAVAKKLGASATINVDEDDPVELVRNFTGDKLADVVLGHVLRCCGAGGAGHRHGPTRPDRPSRVEGQEPAKRLPG